MLKILMWAETLDEQGFAKRDGWGIFDLSIPLAKASYEKALKNIRENSKIDIAWEITLSRGSKRLRKIFPKHAELP